MAKTVADLIIERLMSWGVNTIFGLPGDGINGLFEALRTHADQIRFIQVRHEEAAAFAACGYAKYTGRLGVCMATSGPGGIHLLNGLYDAKLDSQPVLAITGHTFHDLIGTHHQQDVDLDKLFIDVAAYNQRIMGPGHVANVVDEAIKTALSRRAVAHITIPKDIQDWTQDEATRSDQEHPAAQRQRLYAVLAPTAATPAGRSGGDDQRRHQSRHPGGPGLSQCPRRSAHAGRESGGADYQGPPGEGCGTGL
jgi:pyruvate dehydrogenase (quinone)